jgi:hypothetical protein
VIRKQLAQIFARVIRRSPDRAADVIGFLYVILKGVAGPLFRSIPIPQRFGALAQTGDRGTIDTNPGTRDHSAQKPNAKICNENRLYMRPLKIAALTLICFVPAGAQTCTPFSFPAIIVQGQTYQPAIVNGIDQLSTNSVRFQYTSSTSSNAVLIVYATAAQWTANGGKIVAGTAGTNYSAALGTQPIGNTPSGSIFGNNIANLAANTTYYMAGLASNNGGSTWCPEVDESFTTLPWTKVQKPAAPQTFSLTPPTITGTDYTIGTAPCNVGATAYAQFVDCIANEISLSQIASGQNIGIGITPGTPIVVPAANSPFYQWPIPPPAISVTPNSPAANCWTYSTTNVGGGSATLTNGEQVRLASSYQSAPPSPINQGVTYSVVNVNGTCGPNTFQVSQDGTTPLTLADSGGGGTQYIAPWPISQGYLIIHSTASSSNLPPAGVRLDPVAYGSQLGIIAGSGPMSQPMFFGFTSHVWFQDIETTIQANPAAAAETDPPPSGSLFQIGTTADHIIFNQTWEHGPPVPDGLALAGWIMAGSDNAVINSYTDNVENWRPSDDLNADTVGTNTLQLNSGPQGYSGSFYSPSSPTSHYTCSPSATITIGGTAGAFFVSLVPSTCAITVTATTGVTATGSGVTLVNASSPDYPRDTSSICVAAQGKGCYTQLNVGAGSWTGSAITGYQDTNCCGNGPAMRSDWVSAGATGIGLYAGTGPWEIVNNYFNGFSIVGPFRDQDFNNGCPGVTQCPEIANTIDLTVQRNTFQWDPNYISTSATWNGSWWFGRNGPELKYGDRALYDGNIIGPIYSGLGGGECLDLFTYNGATEGEYLLTPVSEFTSDIEFRNNTCLSTGAGIQMTGGSTNGLMPGWGIHRVWIHNNLFDNTNGYLANPKPPNPSAGAHGYGIALVGLQDVTIEHNTWTPNMAGDGSSAVQIEIGQSASLSIQNNIFNYDATTGTPGFSFNTAGQAVPLPAPPAGAQGTALLSYLNNASLNNNIFLCTWSNDQPSSLVEITPSACSSDAALYPANNYFPNSGTTLANRVSAIGWKTPLSYGTAGGNYRLRELSSYISGAHVTSDGLDMGANIDQLEAAQGKVSNVLTDKLSSTGATVEFLAPDSVGLTVDWGTSPFWTGSGTWTRVANAGGQRAQTVALTGLPAHALIYYRVNGAVMQPTGTVQLP